MAARPEDLADPAELEEFYVKTFEFPSGFMTCYQPSVLIASPEHQELATGFPVGKRFKSAPVTRVCDANLIHLGHHAQADGRWRVYVFAPAAPGSVTEFADWLGGAEDSPVVAHTPKNLDLDAWFDVKVIYPRPYEEIDLGEVPDVFLPRTGPFS